MSENLTGRTTRMILFANKSTGVTVSKPAGTEVFVTCLKTGWFNVRVPGTLLEQDVSFTDVEPF